MSIATPSLDKLQRAVIIAEQIQKLEAEMASIFSGKVISNAPASDKTPKTPKTTVKKTRGTKRSLSPEARERIAAAQRARWAKTKGAKASAPAPAPAAAATPKAEAKPKTRGKAKRKISPEAREKMAAAAKRRWAKVKAKA